LERTGNRTNAAFAGVVLCTLVVEGVVVRTLKGTAALGILVAFLAALPSIIGLDVGKVVRRQMGDIE
jgi:hypothetical protein